MAVNDVCRLCLGKDNLVWVFDCRLDNNDYMKSVISKTTGVEIHREDVVSQKICIDCGQLAIKMFQFRENSLKNDEYLKEQCRNLLRNKDNKISHPDISIKTEEIDETKQPSKKTKTKPSQEPFNVHPSLVSLSKQYPKIHFPSPCVKYHVSPIVSMERDVVENYLKARNLKMEDYIGLAPRLNEPEPKIIETENDDNEALTLIEDQSGDYFVENKDNKVPSINLVKNQSEGYSIKKSVDRKDPTNNQPEEGQSNRKKRKFSDEDSSEIDPKKVVLSLSVMLCEICDDVFENTDDFNEHRQRHLCCQLCKSEFESVSSKQFHVEHTCHHKKAIGSFPDVEVRKIEYDLSVRQTYPGAFREFQHNPHAAAAPEVVEILSDDEEIQKSAMQSVSIIKPDIKISNSDLLEKVGKQSSDIQQMKELLKLLERKSDKKSQTDLPRNDSIKVDETALVIELAGLKHFMNYHRIPVEVTKSGSFNASYKYDVVEKKPKKLFYWNDLEPIDVKGGTKSFVPNIARNSVITIKTESGDIIDISSQQTDENCETKLVYSWENKQSSKTDAGAPPNNNNLREKPNNDADKSANFQNITLTDIPAPSELPNDSVSFGTSNSSTQNSLNVISNYSTIHQTNPATTDGSFVAYLKENQKNTQHVQPRILSNVLVTRTSPGSHSYGPSRMYSNELAQRTLHPTPSVIPRTSPNNHPLISTPIHSNSNQTRTAIDYSFESRRETFSSQHSTLFRGASSNYQPLPSSHTSPHNSKDMLSPNNHPPVISMTQAKTYPYNQRHSQEPERVTIPNNQHPMLPPMVSRSSPNNQNLLSTPMHSHDPKHEIANNRTSLSISSPNNQYSTESLTPAKSSPNQHSLSHECTRQSFPANQPCRLPTVIPRIYPDNQYFLSMLLAPHDPKRNQTSLPFFWHDNQQPIVPMTQAKASSNPQARSHEPKLRTPPNNQTPIVSCTSNDQLPMSFPTVERSSDIPCLPSHSLSTTVANQAPNFVSSCGTTKLRELLNNDPPRGGVPTNGRSPFGSAMNNRKVEIPANYTAASQNSLNRSVNNYYTYKRLPDTTPQVPNNNINMPSSNYYGITPNAIFDPVVSCHQLHGHFPNNANCRSNLLLPSYDPANFLKNNYKTTPEHLNCQNKNTSIRVKNLYELK